MVDWVVLLTPLLILGVVALLGFAGCGFEGKLPPPTPPTPVLTLRARVPTTLTVTGLTFNWTPPQGAPGQQPFTNPMASGTDEDDSFYDHKISDPPTGSWTVRCRVAVQEGAATDEAIANGGFTLDGSLTYPTANFQGSGTASDFNLTFAMVT